MPVLKNARHELFCQEIAKGKTLAEAYTTAGYKEDKGNPTHLRDRTDVGARIQELTEANARRTQVTAESLTEELDYVATMAQRAGQYSAAVSAIVNKGKINGFGLDRASVTVNNQVPADPDAIKRALFEDWKASHTPATVEPSPNTIDNTTQLDTKH